MNYLRYAGQLVNEVNGDVVVTSLGLYDGTNSKEEIEDNIINNLGDLVDWWQSVGLKPKIGIEITGQQDVYGSLDQVLDLCDMYGDVVIPVLDFPHYHSRGCGCLVEPADYVNVIEQTLPYCDGKFYARFAGVEHDGDGNELRLTPIKKGDLVFEKLGDALADMCPSGTIISSSPLLEHDAMYMRIIYERMVNKRVAKAIRASKKKESENTE
jgi:deoxyribonuclease-4